MATTNATPRITVFSTQGCVQCQATYKALNKAITAGQIDATSVAVVMIDGSTLDPAKLGALTAKTPSEIDPTAAYTFVKHTLGYQSVPVVTVSTSDDALDAESVTDHWSGYMPPRIAAAITHAATTQTRAGV